MQATPSFAFPIASISVMMTAFRHDARETSDEAAPAIVGMTATGGEQKPLNLVLRVCGLVHGSIHSKLQRIVVEIVLGETFHVPFLNGRRERRDERKADV